jgi:hypothetical protein
VPEGHAHARGELAHPEGLRHIVVGARVERGDVPFLSARGEDKDRGGGPLADPTHDLKAVHVRQPEVQDHEIGLVRRGHRQTLLTRRGL